MTGALGTGTGILLTLGLLYRMYQDLENQRMFDNYSSLGSMLS
jgi:preprotein translocase subunit SecY